MTYELSKPPTYALTTSLATTPVIYVRGIRHMTIHFPIGYSAGNLQAYVGTDPDDSDTFVPAQLEDGTNVEIAPPMTVAAKGFAHRADNLLGAVRFLKLVPLTSNVTLSIDLAYGDEQ